MTGTWHRASQAQAANVCTCAAHGAGRVAGPLPLAPPPARARRCARLRRPDPPSFSGSWPAAPAACPPAGTGVAVAGTTGARPPVQPSRSPPRMRGGPCSGGAGPTRRLVRPLLHRPGWPHQSLPPRPRGPSLVPEGN